MPTLLPAHELAALPGRAFLTRVQSRLKCPLPSRDIPSRLDRLFTIQCTDVRCLITDKTFSKRILLNIPEFTVAKTDPWKHQNQRDTASSLTLRERRPGQSYCRWDGRVLLATVTHGNLKNRENFLMVITKIKSVPSIQSQKNFQLGN